MTIKAFVRNSGIALLVVILLAAVFAAWRINVIRMGGPIQVQSQQTSDLIADILPPPGYVIEAYTSAEAAFQAFEPAEPKPVLIITDYAMHRMNGLELAEACRRIRPNQRVLLVSGTVGPEVYVGARVLPDRFLAKPYEAEELVEAVKEVLAY